MKVECTTWHKKNSLIENTGDFETSLGTYGGQGKYVWACGKVHKLISKIISLSFLWVPLNCWTGSGVHWRLPGWVASRSGDSGASKWLEVLILFVKDINKNCIFYMLQICGGICGGEDAWGGNVYLGGRSNLSGAVQQRADDWRGEVGQCQTWTKYKVYVDTSRLMEESLRTASTILMATTRLWATRLSLMVSLSSERCYFFEGSPWSETYHILLW